MRVDEHEYVCEECGCIYDVGVLEYVSAENDITASLSVYDLLIEQAILEEHRRLTRIDIGKFVEQRVFNKPILITYRCPICKRTICMRDRRSEKKTAVEHIQLLKENELIKKVCSM